MPRLLKPKRAGQPNALSGRAMTANLDQASFDRITWLRHLSIRLLKSEAGTSVLIRRALALYQVHMEQLLVRGGTDEHAMEVKLLALASRGNSNGLLEDDLVAVPLRPFSEIAKAGAESSRAAGVQTVKDGLVQAMR